MGTAKKSSGASSGKYHLKIANSRGSKPVLRDIKKARDLIGNILSEINACDGKDALRQVESKLWDILRDND